MLDSLYANFFKPSQVGFPARTAIVVGLLVVLILALNAAGAVDSGAGGIIGFALLFLFAGGLGWFWLSASTNFVAQLLGGRGNARATMQATARSLWPLILTAPAIALGHWSVTLEALFSLAIDIGVFVALADAIRRVHELNWPKAILCLAITFTLSFLALSGLFLWPVMIILGT